MRLRAALLLVLSTLACATRPPAPPPAESTRAAIEQLEKAIAANPTHTPWIYLLASYYDRALDAESTVRWLKRLDELGWEQGVAPWDFRNTRTRAFRAVAARLDARVPRVARAETVFTLANQRDLIPEGIAYDPVEDVFYLSSLHRRKVLRVDRRGNAGDFIAEGQAGMLGSLGMKVDAKRRTLWVAAAFGPEMRSKAESEKGTAALFAYDLRDGRLIRKWTIGSADKPAYLNDLTLLDDGTVFVTDTMRHSVFRLAPGADELEVWLSEGLRYPNGIVASDDQRALYVADSRGIHRIELADQSMTRVQSKRLINGIDGLVLHDGALVGIQNALGRARVVRVRLDGRDAEILESKNPLFELPTTGVVVDGALHFIANPGLRAFNDDGSLNAARTREPVMLKIAL